ncbi:MAG: hypothetical protein GWO24_15390 [Akkermansiaceae bacterium]|nr:hypothetical protein [Akkermansiaceae bacterium]
MRILLFNPPGSSFPQDLLHPRFCFASHRKPRPRRWTAAATGICPCSFFQIVCDGWTATLSPPAGGTISVLTHLGAKRQLVARTEQTIDDPSIFTGSPGVLFCESPGS